MPREIERTFLVKSDAWRGLAHRSQRMTQGYLASGGRVSLRVRVAGEQAWLNMKTGGLVPSRQEY
jgi:adenylate cyclase